MEWQTMESAPRDGNPVLLTDGHSVCAAWYRSDEKPYPWALVDSFEEIAQDDGSYRLELNAAMEEWPQRWAHYPEAPKL